MLAYFMWRCLINLRQGLLHCGGVYNWAELFPRWSQSQKKLHAPVLRVIAHILAHGTKRLLAEWKEALRLHGIVYIICFFRLLYIYIYHINAYYISCLRLPYLSTSPNPNSFQMLLFRHRPLRYQVSPGER